MLPAVSVLTAGGRVAEIRFTERADGDLAADASWNRVRQVHGTTVIEAPTASSGAAVEGDALVTGQVETPIAVHAADCAPVILVGSQRVAAVHAGWRGLVEGVLERAVDALGGDPADVQAHLGPVIRPRHYQFDPSDLQPIVAEFGSSVRGRTTDGSPALDVPALVAESLRRAGVSDLIDHGYDTADQRFFSHRLRADVGRHAAVVWLRVA
ncbi:MAG TPA: polyphenol oxidase family protein [Acidimicrobiales bacterium]|nr:polyphenol oxidase family protein [Acidimicrobiales bacterium]